MKTFQHHTTVRGEQVTFEVEYYPARRGARDGRFGPPIEPDEPASYELVDWTPAIDLSDDEQEKVIKEIEDRG